MATAMEMVRSGDVTTNCGVIGNEPNLDLTRTAVMIRGAISDARAGTSSPSWRALAALCGASCAVRNLVAAARIGLVRHDGLLEPCPGDRLTGVPGGTEAPRGPGGAATP